MSTFNITRTAKWEGGKWVYDPPLSPEELAADQKRFNDLCQSRQAPGTMGTDRAFLEGHHNHGFTDEPEWARQMVLNKAKEAGVVTTGKKYVGGLADSRGPADPMAWVSDLHEVKKVCEARNMSARGALNYKGHDVAPPADVPLAEKHIASIDKDYALQDPNWSKKKKQERREIIIENHGRPAQHRGAKTKLL